ncbi:MAG: GNAT family N-acetyltransferase [Luminiphilus sp.]|nr:GNAT family N-acetyltransferase [Luminiphilus sp.]
MTTSSAQVHQSLSELDASHWQAHFGHADPFLSWDFLRGLETSGCTSPESGWQPAHISFSESGSPTALLPTYLKSHSYGEYVFDWSWADTWQRMGLRYYPKLVTAIPFTPATGQRFGCQEHVAETLPRIVSAVQTLCETLDVSSWHVLFVDADTSEQLTSGGMTQRMTTQFHWFNRGYRDFADFLDRFSSRKRKNLRREREQIARQGLSLRTLKGGEISDANWQFFHRCYQTTYAKRSGHGGYLTKGFFTETCPSLGQTPVMIVAEQAQQPVAASLFFEGDDTLYGRYWGCLAEFDYLHFEACYYRGIEYCIDAGLSRFDPGAQGEHKIQRGFEPILTHSNHWIVDERLREAVQQFSMQECEHVRAYQREAATLLPFKQENA